MIKQIKNDQTKIYGGQSHMHTHTQHNIMVNIKITVEQ